MSKEDATITGNELQSIALNSKVPVHSSMSVTYEINSYRWSHRNLETMNEGAERELWKRLT